MIDILRKRLERYSVSESKLPPAHPATLLSASQLSPYGFFANSMTVAKREQINCCLPQFLASSSTLDTLFQHITMLFKMRFFGNGSTSLSLLLSVNISMA